MNCREFDIHVLDLQRGELPPDLASQLRNHADFCERCRQRLGDQEELSAILKQVARISPPGDVSASVERSLRQEYRARRRQSITTPLRVRPHRWTVPLGTAAAVAAVIAAIFFSLHLAREGRTLAPPVMPNIVMTVPEPGVAPDPTAAPIEREPQFPSVAEALAEPEAAPGGTEIPAQSGLAYPREIVTDFFPLVYGEGFSPYERPRVVRIQVTNQALAYFGLPVHGDPGEPIPADVLLGEDGTARAVRFVRYASSVR